MCARRRLLCARPQQRRRRPRDTLRLTATTRATGELSAATLNSAYTALSDAGDAIDRAIREIIQPVVERSVTIACVTTRELMLKDFAMEPDEQRMRKAAQLMVQNLAGSLALVTCKEPLRVSMGNHLRSIFQSSSMETAPLEQAIQVTSAENLEVGCTIIEEAAIQKARRRRRMATPLRARAPPGGACGHSGHEARSRRRATAGSERRQGRRESVVVVVGGASRPRLPIELWPSFKAERAARKLEYIGAAPLTWAAMEADGWRYTVCVSRWLTLAPPPRPFTRCCGRGRPSVKSLQLSVTRPTTSAHAASRATVRYCIRPATSAGATS